MKSHHTLQADRPYNSQINAQINCFHIIEAQKLTIHFDFQHLFTLDSSLVWDMLQKSSIKNTDLKNQQLDFLWESTCLEVFLSPAGDKRYIEINIAPNGNWNLYAFDAYRSPDCLPPIRANNASDFFRLLPTQTNDSIHSKFARTLEIDLFKAQSFFQLPCKETATWTINITSVVENDTGLFYFAKKHANPPDFHQKSNWYPL